MILSHTEDAVWILPWQGRGPHVLMSGELEDFLRIASFSDIDDLLFV